MSDAFRQDFFETSDGARLYYELHGEGSPAIVLCDGLGCDGFAWRYLLPRLKRDHRVLHWQYRGHGRSTVPPDERRIGMSYLCEDLDALLGDLGLPRVVLLGHSMGVQVALEYHRRFAPRVLGLGLLCGSYGNPLDTIHDDNQFKKAFPLVRGVVERFRSPVHALLKHLLRTELAIQFAIRTELNPRLIKKDDFAPYLEHLANMDPLVFVRTLDSLAEHSAWDHLPRVDVPTLVVGSQKDRFTPIWLSKRMAEAIPGARFVVLPEGTHTGPLEYPAEVERAVLALLSGLAPRIPAGLTAVSEPAAAGT